MCSSWSMHRAVETQWKIYIYIYGCQSITFPIRFFTFSHNFEPHFAQKKRPGQLLFLGQFMSAAPYYLLWKWDDTIISADLKNSREWPNDSTSRWEWLKKKTKWFKWKHVLMVNRSGILLGKVDGCFSTKSSFCSWLSYERSSFADVVLLVAHTKSKTSKRGLSLFFLFLVFFLRMVRLTETGPFTHSVSLFEFLSVRWLEISLWTNFC